MGQNDQPWVWELLGDQKRNSIRLGHQLKRWSNIAAEVVATKGGIPQADTRKYLKGRCEFPTFTWGSLIPRTKYTDEWTCTGSREAWWWGAIQRKVRDLLLIWDTVWNITARRLIPTVTTSIRGNPCREHGSRSVPFRGYTRASSTAKELVAA